MVRVFLDTNILQDILVGRPGVAGSLALLKEIKEKRISGSISSLSIPIVWYLNGKLGMKRHDLKRLAHYFSVISLTSAMVEKVVSAPLFGDLEDELQYLCAKRSKAKYLITRNVRDFPVKDIAVVTPEEFLEGLK